MTIFDMELMQDFSEIVRYEQAGIPLYIHTTDLSVFPDMCAPGCLTLLFNIISQKSFV